ncbi:uncharacterized protein LOC116614840 isoform X2 [Nematostella vectensis]|uniref:uncharacterized protein LOC116614840 isoform X2 n=1 Tax=Nematostella vectensis TaxID=45351 RepID=UPI0020771ADE|nr:uncharacterized protein LOC116614840 isoform X2 [Nematostella vectensis]
MSFPSQSSVRGNHAADKATRHRLELQDKVFHSASDALEAYIADFEKRTQLYSRRPSDLLAPKPKYYFMDALERSLRGDSSPAKKAEQLVQWVNQTYNRDLSARVEPFGHKSSPELPVSYYPIQRSRESPGSHAYGHPSHSMEGSTEYPSWVSAVGKEYPTWVEDLDSTSVSRAHRSPQHRHSPSSSSDLKHSSSSSLKVSDLRSKSSPGRPHPKRDWPDTASIDTDMLVSQSIYGTKPVNMGGDFHKSLYEDKNVARLNKESTRKLKKGERSRTRTRSESSPKSKSLIHTPSGRPLSPRGYQSVPPKTSRRPEASVSPSTYRDYSPLRSEHLRAASSSERLEPRTGGYISLREGNQSGDRERGQRYVSPSTLIKQKVSGQYNEEYSPSSRKDHEGTMHSTYPGTRKELDSNQYREDEFSPSSRRHYDRTKPFSYSKNNSREDHERTRQSVHGQSVTQSQNHSSSNARRIEKHSPSHSKHYVPRSKRTKGSKQKSKERKEFEGESSDTDREMRKSPTGIRMEKMYREPSTMYPWKTVIQSGSLQDKSVSFSDNQGYGHPVYESTPAVMPKEDIKYVSKGPRSDPNETPHYDFRETYTTKRVTHYEKRPPGNLKSSPKPVFTSTTKQESSVRHKPPSGPKSTQRVGHRRSRTMPDLRKVATKSRHLPRGSRHSYDDDMLSVVTSDTEVLVTQPSMPIVDVSPSLTSVSDSSDTLVGTDSESDRNVRERTRGKLGKGTSTVRFSSEITDEQKLVPNSVFASSSPYAAVREELPKRYHLWKLDDDTTAPDSFIRKKHTPNDKTTIISSFLEDCLNIDENQNEIKPRAPESSNYEETFIADKTEASRWTGRIRAPGPVEALKNMLFTMQDMAHREDGEDEGESTTYRPSRTPELRVNDLASVSDDTSEYSDIFRGHESLQRAYHHLERLKQLVGSEDDRSTASSEF